MLFKSILREIFEQREAIRACAYCDLINPPVLDKTKGRSHGMCKDHYLAYWIQKRNFSPEDAQKQVNKLRDEDFVPNTSGAKPTDPLPTKSDDF